MRDRSARWRGGARPAPETGAVPAVVIPERRARLDANGDSEAISPLRTVAFFGAHIPLALWMDSPQTSIATVHAAAVFIVGGWMAISGRLDRVAMVTGYIVGAEVLWRMTDARVPWEYAKYAAAAIMLLALIRTGRLKPPILAIGFFILLLPSTVLTLSNQPFETARGQISFNLSGPFALTICGWFFANAGLSMRDVSRTFIALIAPVLGVAALAASGTFFSSEVVFSDASNTIASGGFGPNQVSGILGLGAVLALFLSVDGAGRSGALRVVMGAILVGLTAQSALTFSRGGLYGAAGAAAVALCFAAKDARLRSKLVPLLVALFLVGNYFVVPYLSVFTDGEIGVRFQDVRLTGRDRLIQADIALWKDNLILGVGPGEGRLERGAYFATERGAVSALQPRPMAAHTEFSRLLSEHGMFGLMALLLFVVAAVVNLRRAVDARSRAIVAGLSAWSALFMVSTAMRILAPSFAFGLGFLTAGVPVPATEADAGGVRPTTSSQGRRRGFRPLMAGHPALRAGATGVK